MIACDMTTFMNQFDLMHRKQNIVFLKQPM